ncbi:MAG: peptidoglycan DD-metalloendopeptidase family protein [Eubacterium sp.]
MSTAKSNKNEKKNIKALFSVICLCIIALGMIVYFSTNSDSKEDTVNKNTTLVQTTEANRAVTVTETTKQTTTKKKKQTTTQPSTMEQNENNTPYHSYYTYPLTEAVSRGYSEELTYDQIMGDYRAHAAVDFSGTEGDTVQAMNDGLVTSVYTDNLYGQVVQIDHGGRLIAIYCGLDSVSVKPGRYVSIGDKIGTLGKVPCESDQGAHLHLVTKLDGKVVNPLNVMNKTE